MEYDIGKHNPDWITDGLWYNTSIVKKLHVTLFERYIRNVITDRYNLLCYIDEHKKQKSSSVYDGSSDGGNTLPSNFTTGESASLGATIDFIYLWLKLFDHNYLALSNMYI